MATHSPRLLGGLLALILAFPCAQAATRQLIWKNGTPHPDFANELHRVDIVIGVMEDSTVIYEGALTPDPPTPFTYHYGYFYAKPGQNPKPLGGSALFEKIEQVLIGPGNELAVMAWERVGQEAGPGVIYIGTPASLGLPIYTSPPTASSSALPALKTFHEGNVLAFSRGQTFYRYAGGTLEELIFSSATKPDFPASTQISGAYFLHTAKDGRALIQANLSRGGQPVGYGIWRWEPDGKLATWQLRNSEYLSGSRKLLCPDDPVRDGYGVQTLGLTGNSTGLVGAGAESIKRSDFSDLHQLLASRTMGGTLTILEDAASNGGTGFNWQNEGISYRTQMDSTGLLMGRGTAVFPKAPTQRRMTAFYSGGKWTPVATEGSPLVGLPSGVTIGNKHKQRLENAGWFLFTSSLAGTGVNEGNDGAQWLGRRNADGTTSLEIVMRRGDELEFPDESGGTIEIGVAYDSDGDADYYYDFGPDSGRRHTMTRSGKFAQMIYTSDSGPAGLFLFTPTGGSGGGGAEIDIQQPAGSSLVDGKAKKSFGTVKVGKKGTAKSFLIKNTGGAGLTGLSISVDGKAKKDFKVGKPDETTVAGSKETNFKVTFEPTAAGTRDAEIHVKSNDKDENPYDIKVTGMGAKK